MIACWPRFSSLRLERPRLEPIGVLAGVADEETRLVAALELRRAEGETLVLHDDQHVVELSRLGGVVPRERGRCQREGGDNDEGCREGLDPG